MKLLFVINPVSGGKEKRDWEEQIRQYFKTSPHEMEFFILTGKSDAVSVAHHIESVNPERVVGVGGDGTVKMIAEIVKGKDKPLAIIPAGSANGMAKELGIPLNVNEALKAAVHGVVKPIDTIHINDEETCIHLSDIGLNAMLVKQFEKSKKRGMWNYVIAFFKVLWKKQRMHLTIKTDTETFERHAFMVVIANATKYGTGAVINPEGDIADGRLEVVVVRRLNVLELLKMLITRKPFHPNRIEVFSTKTLEITARHKAYFQVDGEYRGKITRLKAVIEPGALQVMLPRPG